MDNLDLEFTDGTPVTSYLATGYAEGFEDPPTQADVIIAWSYLVKSGDCWQLQGWFGRTATAYIENGILDKEGNIKIDLDILNTEGEIVFIQ